MMEDIIRIHLEQTDSTNRYLHAYHGEEGRLMTVVTADYQTAGRGQGTNRWESEAGQNLTFSVKTRPQGVPPLRQFIMLEAGSMALKAALAPYTDDILVKWPNDIYWHDRKLSGTLSECAVSGQAIRSCILGTGLNVNQRRFVSDAPNPVSLFQITGHPIDREQLLQDILRHMAHYLALVDDGQYATIDREYHEALYRIGEWHRYADSGGEYDGRIDGITPQGRLCVTDRQGHTKEYAFKEVKFII